MTPLKKRLDAAEVVLSSRGCSPDDADLGLAVSIWQKPLDDRTIEETGFLTAYDCEYRSKHDKSLSETLEYLYLTV